MIIIDMRRRGLFATVVLAVWVGPAAGQSIEDCRAISNAAARLNCYDRIGKPATEPEAKIEASRESRWAYAKLLERRFLSKNINISVFPLEKAESASDRRDQFKQYPRLILFGYFDKSFVYRVLTETPILEMSKEIGYRGIEFYDRGPEGRFLFDLSKNDLPKCDVASRLCL